MVTIVKHEWHQVDSQFALELEEDIIREIYPDMDDEEIETIIQQLESGEADLDQILSDAWDNDVDIEWDHQYDDWWTSRKGGYDVTYEYGDEDSYYDSPKEPDPTHKCTKCRWEGSRYNTLTQYLREDGTIIENYYEADEDHHSTKEVCPMCDSDTELTEAGIIDEQERKEREARWAAQAEENEEIEEEDMRSTEERLQELKEEFEKLMTKEEAPAIQPMKCTQCEWHGDWAATDTNDAGNDICPDCGSEVKDVEE